MSDNLDESQDWPLRDYSARLRPPRSADEPAAVDPEPEPEPIEPEPSFDPPASSSGVEVLYDEDEPRIDPPAVPEEQAPVETPEASVETPEVETPEVETPDVETPEPEAPAEDSAEITDVPRPTTELAETDNEHAEGDLRIPDGVSVLEGSPNGNRRTVAIVVSRFNGEITDRLLDSAMTALD
jgi:hypothetical protein